MQEDQVGQRGFVFGENLVDVVIFVNFDISEIELFIKFEFGKAESLFVSF